MTIHGSPGTLDVVVRMLAGLWGEGRAPIPLQLVPLAEGRILDAGEFTVDCFRVRHRDTESFAFTPRGSRPSSSVRGTVTNGSIIWASGTPIHRTRRGQAEAMFGPWKRFSAIRPWP
jgi:hypothetical protein